MNYCNYFERSLIEKEKAAAQSVSMPSRVRSIKPYQSIIAAIHGTFGDLQACNCIIRYFFLDDDLLLLYLSSKVNVRVQFQQPMLPLNFAQVGCNYFLVPISLSN